MFILIIEFTKVGNKWLLLEKQHATYHEAVARCEALDSELVEFSNVQEYDEVDLNKT